MKTGYALENKLKSHTVRQKEYYRHYKGSSRIVIFIHGIIEGPRQFRNLAKLAYMKGNSVYCLLLPGHGGDGENFAKTDFKRWIRYVSREINKMRGCYRQIILVGHSMGALFCICEAAANQEKIQKIVLIDTPLKIHVWPRVLWGAGKIMTGRIHRTDKYVISEYNAISVLPARGINVRYLKWLKRYLELFAIIRYTRKKTGGIKIPSLLIFSKKDEFVSLKSEKYFDQAGRQFQKLILKDSGHFCYNHADLECLEKYFIRFIEESKE